LADPEVSVLDQALGISAVAIASATAVSAAAVFQWVIAVASEAGRQVSAAGLPARAVCAALPALVGVEGVAEVLVVVVAVAAVVVVAAVVAEGGKS
jgi:hypothetical protein